LCADVWWKEHGRYHFNPDFGKVVDRAIENIENNPDADYWATYDKKSNS